MGRSPRIVVPDGYYHVHTRGNDRQTIYFGNWSGRLFVRELERASRRYGWRVLAYCLMTNHYHVVMQITDDLSHGMCELNSRFAAISNWINKRSNHLFGERFTSHLIEDDAYFLAATRYVLLNPVRCSPSIDRAERWRWSSMRATIGLEHPPACLDTTWLLSQFGRNSERARARFREFVADGAGGPVPVPGTDPRWSAPTARG
jgi:REP element-mobilizing transposase RayT